MSSDTANRPPAQTTETTVSRHRWLVRSLIGLATLLAIIAVFAVWANRQLLNTDSWTQTSSALIESPPVREAVSGYLTEQIYDNVDVTGELRSGLPSQFKPLAAPAAGALRNIVQRGVSLALQRPLVQELWRTANERLHAQFVKLIEDRGTVVRLPGEGTVVLDLGALLTEAAKRVGVPAATVAKIPPDVGEVQVFKADQLQAMQSIVNLLRYLAIVLPLLALALYALAVYLARGRRAQTLIAVGAGLIITGLTVLIARSLAGRAVVDALAGTEALRPAADAVWSIATSVLADIAGATIFVGVPVILAGMLGGPTRSARDIRRWLAPYLRDRAGLSFAAVGLLLLILFAWGPITATRSWIGILIIIALTMFGLQMLRRQTAAEFPDADLGEPIGLRERAAAISARLRRGDASEHPGGRPGARRSHDGPPGDGEPTTETHTPRPPEPATPGQAPGLPAELAQLASLHSSGALTDEEYQTAKQHLLSTPTG